MIPRLFQLKTIVSFTDDNLDFLNNFKCLQDKYYIIIDEHPLSCLDKINQINSQNLIDNIITTEDDDDVKSTSSLLFKEMFNCFKNNFCLCHCVIVDYDMPMINGVEFCKKISDKYVKKIVLTGYGDENMAVKAFNNGLINCFVKKSEINLLEKITELLSFYQKQYFSDLSEQIINFCKTDFLENIYKNEKFWFFFERLLETEQFESFTLYNSDGCFALKKSDGSIYLLNNYSCLEIKNMVIESDSLSDLSVEDVKNLKDFEVILDYKNLGQWFLDESCFNYSNFNSPIFIDNKKDGGKIFFTLKKIQ